MKDKDSNDTSFKIGDRVIVKAKNAGVVKFVGPLNEDLVSPPTYVGVQLYDNVESLHNGMWKGKRYFHCPPGHGALVKCKHVAKVSSQVDHKSASMFPSYQEIKARRRERIEKDPDSDFGPPYGSSRPKSSTANVQDKNDMALKDAEKQKQEQKKKNTQRPKSNTHQRNNAAGEKDVPKRDIQHWKKKFGDDERAERMARTLQKLHVAYEKGLEYHNDEEETESETEEVTSVQDTSSVSETQSETSSGQEAEDL